MTSDKKKHTRPLVPKEPRTSEKEEIITPVETLFR